MPESTLKPTDARAHTLTCYSEVPQAMTTDSELLVMQ